jgi:hypothetical protein
MRLRDGQKWNNWLVNDNPRAHTIYSAFNA